MNWTKKDKSSLTRILKKLSNVDETSLQVLVELRKIRNRVEVIEKELTTVAHHHTKPHIKLERPDFQRLPYVLVVSRILPFHVVRFRHIGESELEYFGYFSHDPFRHVWFVFRSIDFDDPPQNNILLSRRYLTYTRFYASSNRDVNRYYEFLRTGQFLNLSSVEMNFRKAGKRVRGKLMPLLAEGKNFPSLTSLEITLWPGAFGPRQKTKNVVVSGFSKMEKMLTSVSFNCYTDYFCAQNGNLDKFKNLRKMSFDEIDFGTLKFNPELRSLDQVKILTLKKCSRIDILFRIVKSRNIVRLKYNDVFYHENNPPTTEYDILKTLPFYKLERILIDGPGYTTKLDTSSLNLKNVKMAWFRRFDMTNFLSMMKVFPQLLLLCLSNTKLNRRGQREMDETWKHFQAPNLHVLILQNVEGLTDAFFQQEKDRFPRLEQLKLINNHELSGSDWNMEFGNLQELVIQVGIMDDLFVQNNFPILRKLKMENNGNITGKGWKPIPNLEYFSLRYMNKFDDDCFVENSFPRLKFLIFHGCKTEDPRCSKFW